MLFFDLFDLFFSIMERDITNTDGTILTFVKLTKDAKPPERGSINAAGLDLFSAKTVLIPSRGRGMVPTDIAIHLPKGTYGRIAPRSGMAVRHSIGVGGGVIDYDFTGNVTVILFNHGDQMFKVEKGDRIAQLIIEKISQPVIVEVNSIQKTVRGANGFGSTGI